MQRCLAIAREINNNETVRLTACPAMGELALVEGRYEEARQYWQEAVTLCENNSVWLFEGSYRGHLAVAELRLGHHDRAWACLVDALRTVVGRLVGTTHVMHILPPVALFLAEQGQAGCAVEIYALAQRYAHIANSRWDQDVFGRPLATVAASLPAEEVAEAQERGHARDLEATIRELLIELGHDMDAHG